MTIETTTKTSSDSGFVAPKALSQQELRAWAFESLCEIATRLKDLDVLIPVQAYLQALESNLDTTEKRLQIAERTSEALFTKVVMSETK